MGDNKGKRYLFIRVLEACNADCFMCGFALSRDGYRFGLSDLEALMPAIHASDVGFLRFTGGEPLLHKELGAMLELAREHGLKTSIITNGWSLASRAESLEAAGLDQIVVSIDSCAPDEHDRYRNLDGLFYRALAGIDKCRELGIKVRVNTVVGPHNYRGMVALGEKLAGVGVTQWELSSLKLDKKIVYDDPDDVVAVGEQVFSGAHGLVPMGKRWYGDSEDEQRQYFENGIPPRASAPACLVTEDVMYLDAKNSYLFPCSLLPHRSTADLYGAPLGNVDGNPVLDTPAFLERRQFYRDLGPKMCTGCSSTAAGYSGDRAKGIPAEDWSY